MSHRHRKRNGNQNSQVARPNGYGFIKGRAVAGGVKPPKSGHGQSHYHIHIKADQGGDFDVAVNILSVDNSEVLYFVDHGFLPDKAKELMALPHGFHVAQGPNGNGLGLDFVAQDLVKKDEMQLLPKGIEEGEGDLHDEIDDVVQRAITDATAEIYAFGKGFANDATNPFYGFRPDIGIHDIHMNQGNPAGSFARDNGRFTDGALLVHIPSMSRWLAVFVAFQLQSWDNDDRGNPN